MNILPLHSANANRFPSYYEVLSSDELDTLEEQLCLLEGQIDSAIDEWKYDAATYDDTGKWHLSWALADDFAEFRFSVGCSQKITTDDFPHGALATVDSHTVAHKLHSHIEQQLTASIVRSRQVTA